MRATRRSGRILLLVVLFACLFWFDRIFIFIDSGQAGVRWGRFTGTEMHTYDEGLHIIWPWDRMYLYVSRLQSIFEEISGLPILRWRGLDVTEKLATSDNAKVVIIGTGSDQLPLILNTDSGPSTLPKRSEPTPSPDPIQPDTRVDTTATVPEGQEVVP